MTLSPDSAMPLRSLWFALLATAFVLAGCPARRPWQGITPERFARLEEHRFVGIGWLENDRAGNARPEFAAIRKAEPALAFGYVNEAVCLLRLPKGAEEAVRLARAGAERQPNNAWAQMVLGRAYEAAGQPQAAARAFARAVELAPNQPRILGAFVRHLHNQPGTRDPRLPDLRRRLAEAAPGNLVAQLDWLQEQADARQYADALRTLGRIRKLLPDPTLLLRQAYARAERELAAGSPGASASVRLFGNLLKAHPLYTLHNAAVYGNDLDPADLAMREWDVPPPHLPPPPLPPAPVAWTETTREAGLAGQKLSGIAPAAVGDVDLAPEAGQRRDSEPIPFIRTLDLALGTAPEGLLLNQDGRFSGSPAVAPGSPLLADFDNDFALDLYAARPEGDRLWANPRGARQTPEGLSFSRAPVLPMKPAPNPPGRGPGAPLAVDLDQDGDLDVVRPSESPGEPGIRYLRNNGNLTFTDLTRSARLFFPSRGARQAVFADFDRDGDPDLLVVQSAGPCRLFLNERQDLFREGTAAWGLKTDAGARAAAAADVDRDGDWDVALASRAPHGSVLYRNEGSRFRAEPLPLPRGADWLAFLDFDNDAAQDLAAAGPDGLQVLHNDGGRFAAAVSLLDAPCAWVRPLDYDRDGDLDLLATTASGELRLFRNDGGNRRPWLQLELQGYLIHAAPTPGQATQANNSYAIGAEVEPKTVWETQKLLVTEPLTHIGLGRAQRAIAVRVTWTHGVPQNRIGPAREQAVRFEQTPQGSCPFLYAWDGHRWRFVTDFNWRSPLGMLFARGAPIPHDQTEDWVRIPGEWVEPLGSCYAFIATEELREVSYFDAIRLFAVDHPREAEVYVDERFRFGPPPTMRIYTARNRRLPVAAWNDRGEDLLPALRAADGVYTPVPPGPYRGVCRPHDLILELGSVPDPSNVRLFLSGWIYPAGTSVNVAAAQNPSVRIVPPTLSVGDGRGGWRVVDRNVGLPCGKRKTIVLDLSGRFTAGDYRVRLTTTMEIRWDAAFFTSADPPVPVVRTEAPLASALLDERGYGRRYRETPDGPDLFDYERRLPPGEAPDWPPITGAYTRLGECAPLLRGVDDRYAILGPGDELRLLFDASRLPPLPPGWKRDFILWSDGWTKDSDRNTVSGETVEPLPFHGMKRYPYAEDERFPATPAHRAWRAAWNTRLKGKEGRSARSPRPDPKRPPSRR